MSFVSAFADGWSSFHFKYRINKQHKQKQQTKHKQQKQTETYPSFLSTTTSRIGMSFVGTFADGTAFISEYRICEYHAEPPITNKIPIAFQNVTGFCQIKIANNVCTPA
jgi:hypothetical protein